MANLLPAGELCVSDFVNERIAYLSELPCIGYGWIAGGGVISGVAPSGDACSRAIEVLTVIGSSPEYYSDLTPTSLLLGPLTAGGVAIEMRFIRQGLTIHIALPNEGAADITLHRGSVFDEHELPWSDALCLLKATLRITDVIGATVAYQSPAI